MNAPIVNSAINPEILLAFACAAWDAMAPAEREAVIEEVIGDTLPANECGELMAHSAGRKFYDLPRLCQYYAAACILLGPFAQFKGVRP